MPQRPITFSADSLHQICIEAGADDAGFVEIGRDAFASEREGILRVYAKTRTIISIIKVMNRENLQSPPRYVANDEFHKANDNLSEISRRILRRLNELGVRGVVPPVGFPMDMSRFPGKLWDVSHKLIAVQAGLGHMGINRNVIHPKFGNHILLDSILIDVELDKYGQPLDYNPCIGCNLCVSVCPVGAIHPDGKFDFVACMTHNYREFLGGFQDWVDTLESSKNPKEYRSKVRDTETASLWQSLSFGANYKSAYCMAVCPAGENVLGNYLPNKKAYVEQVVKPLKERMEPIYVIKGTMAESVAKRNPNKEIRHVHTPLRPTSVASFLGGIELAFNPEKAKGMNLRMHFEFSGIERRSATITVANGQLGVQDGIVGNADLQIRVDSQLWVKLVNGDVSIWSILWAIATRKFTIRGNPRLLSQFRQCVAT